MPRTRASTSSGRGEAILNLVVETPTRGRGRARARGCAHGVARGSKSKDGHELLTLYHEMLETLGMGDAHGVRFIVLNLCGRSREWWRTFMRSTFSYVSIYIDTGFDMMSDCMPVPIHVSAIVGVSLNKDIDFSIDLELGTKPISIPPYRIAPTKLKELKD
ncbi:hypothetical protein MTR67_034916 [Solanum verrucosum]|uniref:Uncharacterized protein n=1 Tax=Solanum verrucosum TaxID=315347 RepID=A0AAF0U9F8_SOLVR|nr:hypothetical protein MTR67_034916 [Solanum verrucosum]